MREATEQFREEIRSSGLEPPDVIEPDRLHRFAGIGKRNGNTAGWCKFFSDGKGGVYGDWSQDFSESWQAKRETPLTEAERKAFKDKCEREKQARQAERDRQHAEARKMAQKIWGEAKPEIGEHRYLRDKGANAHGIRCSADRLVIPVRSTDGTLHSVQYIDPRGAKRFLKEGRISGCYHAIGKPSDTLCVCEGYATGASIHEATGYAVAVAFNAGNIEAVARALREKLPDIRIILCADDDIYTQGNTGLTKATTAAHAVNAALAIPDFADNRPEGATDFNDLARCRGLEAVKACIANAKAPAEPEGQSRPDKAPTGAVTGEEWPEPNPIKAELSPVEPLPTAIIPEPYRARVADASERMQTPPDFMATAAVVMTGAVIGTACTIKPKRRDDWQIVPNLWGGAVGRPSVLLKTPAMKEALNPLARLELDAKQAYESEQRQYEADIEMHKAARDAIKDRMKKAAKGKAGSAENIAELKLELCNLNAPDGPVWRRYKTNDATVEKCNELMRDNPRGLLLFRDELIGLLAGWEKPGHESDRAYFLEGWNGNQGHTDDRIGRGTTYAENVCISLYGGIQPAKLQTYLYQCMRGLENDGLMQRLQLAVYPDEPKTWQLVDRYPDTEAKNRVYKIIEALSKADFAQYGAKVDEGDKLPSLRFADDAQALFYEWLAELQEKLQGDDEPVILEHLGKYRSLMPSLALIFHLIEIADGTAQPGPVSFRAAEFAAAWCDYLESHARRIYGLVTNATKQAAATLASKIRKGKLNDRFTVRDVYRQNWHLLTDRESAQNACDELVADGWLREHVTPASFGQKGKIAYLINPKAKVA